MKSARSRTTQSILRSIFGICILWLPIGSAAAGDWTITPRISGQELFTDNVLQTPSNRRSDFVTSLSPGIGINGESARLTAKLDYSPVLQLYALTPGQNFLGHNLYANGTATIIPDLFFFDARGYAALQPTNPALGTGLSGTVPIPSGPSFTNTALGVPKNQLSQVASFTASPYLQRRFDGFGVGEVRYSISDTTISGTQTTVPLAPPGFAAQNSNQLINEGTATFLTGEEFGRYSGRFLLDAAQSSGTGTLNGDQLIATLDSAYAITRRIAALWTIGHETMHFGGSPPTTFDDVVWGIGTQLTPTPDATLVLTYGHRNGVTAPYASVVYNLTARTVLSATYSEGVTTVNQQIANNLAISDLNIFGQTVDSRTLLPLAITNPALGLQAGLFHTKLLTGTASTDLERDHFSGSIYRTENLLIAQSTPGSGTSERTTGINVNWSRELNPLTTANLGFGYSSFSFPSTANSSANLFTATASLNYQFSSSVSGWTGYSFTDRMSPQPQLRLTANIFFVGLRKTF